MNPCVIYTVPFVRIKVTSLPLVSTNSSYCFFSFLVGSFWKTIKRIKAINNINFLASLLEGIKYFYNAFSGIYTEFIKSSKIFFYPLKLFNYLSPALKALNFFPCVFINGCFHLRMPFQI